MKLADDHPLRLAEKLRAPRFTENGEQKSASRLVDELADYTLETAYHQGELASLRLELHDSLRELEREWDDLEGWEMFRNGKTEASIDRAKAQLKPELAQGLSDARWLVARLNEQIGRLERDSEKVSRAYTMLNGS